MSSRHSMDFAWTHIGWVRWMFQNLPLLAAQEVRDSSGVTTYIVMKNDGALYYQVRRFLLSAIRLRSICQSVWTIARDPVQHKRWTYPCYRASIRNINKDGCADGVPRLPNIWQKVINKGGRATILIIITIIVLIILLANQRYDRYTIDQWQPDDTDSFPLSKLHW